ncbi:MAG: hypothetical protein AAGA46_12285 [Cyanobacteria bacterium P01_F01_bin.13]
MVYSPSQQSSKSLFNEVVIADFGAIQIAVLTIAQPVKRRIFSTHVSVPERTYQTQGWLIYNQQIIAHLEDLKIGSIFPDDEPFSPLYRLSPAVPLSFQVYSSHTLPLQVTKQATFACELQGADFPYHTIFRNIAPHFVRIYPFGERTNLLKNVKQLLQDEADFINQNRDRLKQVAFFQKRFRL